MHRMFHTANDNHGKTPRKPRFSIMETLGEIRYSRLSSRISRIDAELAACRGKKLVLGHLELEARSSIVEQDESNWDSAMKAMERAALHRKSLSKEVRGVAASIFCGVFAKSEMTATIIGLALNSASPGSVTATTAGVVTGLLALGSAIYSFIMVSTEDERFLGALRGRLDSMQDGLMAERQRLMRHLHGI